jgi:hypothetical protein
MSEENNLLVDIAVLCQEYTHIDLTCNDHIKNLDVIEITEDDFKNIFYPNGETFGLNKLIMNNKELLPYISFIYPYRTTKGKPFSLLEEIYRGLEEDLNISRTCFTTCTSIELTNQLTKIYTLLDINDCSVLCSLQWSNILNIIREQGYNKEIKKPLFVISVVFKTPTPTVKPTIIKFNYSIKLENKS